MPDRKPPSTLDILLVLPWRKREEVGHPISYQGVNLAGAVVAAGGDVADDILKPRSGNAEPFGQEAQFAKRPVRIDEVKVLVENSNAARQEVEGSALNARAIGKVRCRWIEGHRLSSRRV
jgi:hypothetical protein